MQHCRVVGVPEANERDCSLRGWVKIASKRIRECDDRCFFERWHSSKRSRSRPMHAADHLLANVRLQRLRNGPQPRRDFKGATQRQAKRPVSHAILVLGLAGEDRLKRRYCARAGLQELLLGGHHRPRVGEVGDECKERRSRHGANSTLVAVLARGLPPGAAHLTAVTVQAFLALVALVHFESLGTDYYGKLK